MNYKKIITFVITLLILVVLFQTTSLNIYTLDDNGKLQINSSIKVLRISPTDKKLSRLASKMSKHLFSQKKIVLTSIKTEEGKEIAYFDLQDKEEELTSPNNWHQSFQGSTGAQTTLASICETLLQKNYKGNWIDGIKLTYNGEYAEFDHITFDDIVYWRK